MSVMNKLRLAKLMQKPFIFGILEFSPAVATKVSSGLSRCWPTWQCCSDGKERQASPAGPHPPEDQRTLPPCNQRPSFTRKYQASPAVPHPPTDQLAGLDPDPDPY
jgi:hypothetical protein